MRVDPVISRNTRKSSVISSGATAADRGNVCVACTANCFRFSLVSAATKIVSSPTGRQNVPLD